MDAQIKWVMSFGKFIHLKERLTTRVGLYLRGGSSNHEVKRLVGKFTLPNFDGGENISARIWIQKMDTYFILDPMKEANTIRFCTLHLEGDAQEWCYHGLITLGHIHITSYQEFTRRLLERFEGKDPEL